MMIHTLNVCSEDAEVGDLCESEAVWTTQQVQE